MVTMLYIRSPEFSPLITDSLYSDQNLLIFPLCKPPEPPIYFVSMSLAFLGSTCKWDNIVFVLSPVFLTILTDVNDISW